MENVNPCTTVGWLYGRLKELGHSGCIQYRVRVRQNILVKQYNAQDPFNKQ